VHRICPHHRSHLLQAVTLVSCYVHKYSFLQYIFHSYLSILLLLFSFYFHITECFCYVTIYLVTDIFQFMSLNRNAFLLSTN